MRHALILCAGVCLSILTACSGAPKVPLETVSYPFAEGTRQKCLIVLLPGMGNTPKDFEEQGFIEEARQSDVRADMIAVGLDIDYYTEQIAARRLNIDVIAPARKKGYKCIWMAGVSLGGFGALDYEMGYPARLDGIVLIAPYLGEAVPEDIIRSGGLKTWRPGNIEKDDYEQRLWKWIRDYKLQNRHRPAIYLAYGAQDRYAGTHQLMASALAGGNVMTLPGGHSWDTWRKLWHIMLMKLEKKLR